MSSESVLALRAGVPGGGIWGSAEAFWVPLCFCRTAVPVCWYSALQGLFPQPR